MDSSNQKTHVTQLILSTLDKLLGSGNYDATAAFMDMGIDSLGATVFQKDIQSAVGNGITITASVMFDYPTVASLVEYIRSSLELTGGGSRMVAGFSDVSSPLAVVGMATYAPGHCLSPQNLWDLLCSGRDCISKIPVSRFDVDVLKGTRMELYVHQGHFLDDVESFDNDFFGIGPSEAMTMDPHQRLLIEVEYEALVMAGYTKGELMGKNMGLFLGFATASDWSSRQSDANVCMNAFSNLGADSAGAAGRLSYLLGLKGPCFTINTACSSAMVALDSAGQSLRLGRVPEALVAGVNLQLHPSGWAGFCAMHALSRDGQCKTFDASADGFGRSEAVGAIVLTRLADAEKGSSRILGIICGTAVNQDGRSASFMAPNGPSQEAVIRSALHDGAVDAADVCYLECHGTGTSIGDPMEVGALRKVIGNREEGSPLVLGAIKSNLGHTEGAAGIMGVIKVIMALERATIPSNLHLKVLNPGLDLAGFPVLMPGDVEALISKEETPLIAGVSSFGYSGTNAHAILKAPPALFKSASPGKVAFLFTGQGSQYEGMGRELYEKNTTFRAVLQKCDKALLDVLPHPLVDVLYGADEAVRKLIHNTRYAQPALYAVEVAMAEVWRTKGVEALVVLGHSVGEYAAACVAGMMSVETGARLIAERGRLMSELAVGGSMVSVMASEEEVQSVIASTKSRAVVAVVNGPTSVAVSGDEEAVSLLIKAMKAGTKWKALEVSHAFHSSLMQPILAQLRETTKSAALCSANVQIVSNVTGNVVQDDAMLCDDYWCKHALQPVLFMKGMRTLESMGCDTFLEVGPQGVLCRMGRKCMLDEEKQYLWLSSMEKGQDAATSFEMAHQKLMRISVPNYKRVSFPMAQNEMWCTNAMKDSKVSQFHEIIWSSSPLPDIAIESPGESCVFFANTAHVKGAGSAIFHSKRGEVSHALNKDTKHVVFARALEDGVCLSDLLTELIDIVQHIHRLAIDTTIYLISRSASGPPPILHWEHAGLWGFARSLRLEHPNLLCRTIDYDGEVFDASVIFRLFDHEADVAIRGNVVHMPRLQHTDVAPLDETSVIVTGTYVITGGTGALGMYAARWLVEHGVKHVLLCSRSGTICKTQESEMSALRAAAGEGARIEIIRCDVALSADVEAVFSFAETTGFLPIIGVIHAAGVQEHVLISEMQDSAQVAAVLNSVVGPKIRGTQNLYAAVQAHKCKLDLFVLYSSVSAFLGLTGGSVYAAANGALDAFAHYGRNLGFPVCSIQWGAWTEIGMAASQLEGENLSATAGFFTGVVDKPLAGKALNGLMGRQSRAEIAVMEMNWGRFLLQYDSPPAILNNCVPSSDARSLFSFGSTLLGTISDTESTLPVPLTL